MHVRITKKNDFLIGFSVKNRRDVVPVLQYANDTLLLLEDDLDMVENVKTMLLLFEATLGLHVNRLKTRAYKIVEARCWEEMIPRWNCITRTLPKVYLGLPLASKYKHKFA